MVQWPVTGPIARRASHGLNHIKPCPLYRLGQVHPLGDTHRAGRGEGTAGAVGMATMDTWALQQRLTV